MTNQEALKLTRQVFNLIKKSKTISDLENIPDKLKIPIKNRISINDPKIEFSIKKSEIQNLIDNKIVDNDHNFTTAIKSKLTDPVTKLLYAIAWKNGDLKKIKHIIKGILDNEKDNNAPTKALVFYQFGKY